MATPRPTENTQPYSMPDKLMQRLLNFEPTGAPVVSLYLDARVDQQGKHRFMPFVKKQLSELAKTFPKRSPEEESFLADAQAIDAYLQGELQTDAQGICLFVSSGAGNLFAAGHFDIPFPSNRMFVFDRPHVYPLARLLDAYPKYAVVLADTNRAQIFVFAAGKTVDEQTTENVKTNRTQVGGWSQARYQRHQENYHLQHVKEVVENLERVVREEQIEHVIIAGDNETVIPLLREQLPKALEEKVIDVLSLSIAAPEHEVLEESLQAFRVHDSLSDQQKVERLLGEYRGDNLAVAGVPETLAALSNGQCEELLIGASVEGIKYDDEEVKKVLELYGADEELLEKLEPRVVADELVRRANQLSSARVTFIEDAKRLEQVGGVGSFLRYRISAEHAAPYDQTDATPRAKALVKVEE